MYCTIQSKSCHNTTVFHEFSFRQNSPFYFLLSNPDEHNRNRLFGIPINLHLSLPGRRGNGRERVGTPDGDRPIRAKDKLGGSSDVRATVEQLCGIVHRTGPFGGGKGVRSSCDGLQGEPGGGTASEPFTYKQ
jgi:hypothetical protein